MKFHLFSVFSMKFTYNGGFQGFGEAKTNSGCHGVEIPSIWHSNSLSKHDGRTGINFYPRNTENTIILVEITKNPLKELKCWFLGASGCKNGVRRGHRVWTSYYCSKLVAFTPFTSLSGYFPPQIPKNHHLGDFHENSVKWVEFSAKGSPQVEIP